MADKDYSKIAAYRRDFLSRKQLLAGTEIEFFDGTGAASQVHYLSRHADGFFGVLQLSNAAGTAEIEPNKGKWLNETGTLTAKPRAYTYDADARSVTFGNGTNGYKPPDTSADTFYAFAIVYIPLKGAKTVTTTLTWTEQVVADNVAPDTDTAIFCDGATDVTIEFDTTNASTNAPNFDLDVIASVDGTTYQSVTLPLVTAFTAQLEALVDNTHINVGAAKFVKGRLDVNNQDLAAAEYVTARFKVTWRY